MPRRTVRSHFSRVWRTSLATSLHEDASARVDELLAPSRAHAFGAYRALWGPFPSLGRAASLAAQRDALAPAETRRRREDSGSGSRKFPTGASRHDRTQWSAAHSRRCRIEPSSLAPPRPLLLSLYPALLFSALIGSRRRPWRARVLGERPSVATWLQFVEASRLEPQGVQTRLEPSKARNRCSRDAIPHTCTLPAGTVAVAARPA